MLHVLLMHPTFRKGGATPSRRWSPDVQLLLSADRSPRAEQAACAIEARLFFEPRLLAEAKAALAFGGGPVRSARRRASTVLWS